MKRKQRNTRKRARWRRLPPWSRMEEDMERCPDGKQQAEKPRAHVEKEKESKR